jgi:hypothetical protein
MGRRLDLRDCHRDPGCHTHRDPLAPCSCRSLFLRWDFLIDWVLFGVLIGSGLLVAMLLSSTFS